MRGVTRIRAVTLLVPLVLVLAGCHAERRPTNTTSVSAPLDEAKPLAGLKPEAITVAPSPQFTAYSTLRTDLNNGATALEAGDREKAAGLLANSQKTYDSEFASTVQSTDGALATRIQDAYKNMATAASDGDAATYRRLRYVIDIGILRLATLKSRDALAKNDVGEAERWFSTIANRFDLSKDVQPVGAAWKRFQTGPVDAAAQKAFNLALAGYLSTKARSELKGAGDGLNEKNAAKARWENSGGLQFFEAMRETYQQQLGEDATKKMADTLAGFDAAVAANDEAKARSLLEEANKQLDQFDRSLTA
jgi:ribosomal protein S20